MSDRIHQLEDAVATMQTSLSLEPHPLLHPDLLRIKSSAELHRAQVTAYTKSTPSPPQEHTDGEPAKNIIPSVLPQEHAYDFRAPSDVSATLAPEIQVRTNSVTLVRQGHYSTKAQLIYLRTSSL